MQSTSSLIKLTGSIIKHYPGIYYPENEVYIDIIENINLLVNKTGEVIRSEIIGKVVDGLNVNLERMINYN